MKNEICQGLLRYFIRLFGLVIMILIGAVFLYPVIYLIVYLIAHLAVWMSIHPDSWITYTIVFIVVIISAFIFRPTSLIPNLDIILGILKIVLKPARENIAENKELFQDQHISYYLVRSVTNKDKSHKNSRH